VQNGLDRRQINGVDGNVAVAAFGVNRSGSHGFGGVWATSSKSVSRSARL
jgi:hypothetical protein